METNKETKKCCSGLGPFGNCGRGTREGCMGIHCKCMETSCSNMHYVDCKQHYIHVEMETNKLKSLPSNIVKNCREYGTWTCMFCNKELAHKEGYWFIDTFRTDPDGHSYMPIRMSCDAHLNDLEKLHGKTN